MGKLRLIDDPHGPAVRLDPDGAIGNASNLHRRLLLHRTNCLRSSIRVFRLFKGTPAVRPEASDLFCRWYHRLREFDRPRVSFENVGNNSPGAKIIKGYLEMTGDKLPVRGDPE